MEYIDGESLKDKITYYGRKKVPFFFVIDFTMNKGLVLRPQEATRKGILFNINGKANLSDGFQTNDAFRFESYPVSYRVYKQAFDTVMVHLKRGDTYLLNLTFPTAINTTLTLKQIFHRSKAQL